MAARCGPRAIRVTSTPWRASRPPIQPPMAPAPKMQSFMLALTPTLSQGERKLLPEPQLLGQADALDLAGGALRDLGQDDHLARHLEVGEAAGAEVAELALGGRSDALHQHHGRRYLLAEAV